MAVLLYQVGIFLAIIIASAFGKKSRNTAVILISIFTIVQVYMSWLLLLQFFTIFLAYQVSNSLTNKKIDEGIQKIPIKTNTGFGLSENSPVLVTSIPSSYQYINRLNSYSEHLSYIRRGSTQSPRFGNMIDIYEFKYGNRHFCTVYIYPYASVESSERPKPFHHF
jgi:uncharacterized membrane protein (DUF485 family)